jgi:hypothetical protein
MNQGLNPVNPISICYFGESIMLLIAAEILQYTDKKMKISI